MRFLAPLVLLLAVACARPARSPSPDHGRAPPGAEPGPAGAGVVQAPLAPENAALAWMLGVWECDATDRAEATAAEVRGRGRLIVDGYMDVWMGAGFEAEAPAVPKGDMYFRYEPAARTWSLVGFRSDGARYELSSPGELVGRVEWTGTMTRAGKVSELKAAWTHKSDADLDLKMDRRDGAGWATFHLACVRQPSS